ncbi:hypothetical protein V8G54_003630 [Vigna mungo]|uniref:Uncharacterized protein n=1 Tax=Vigna mungo TaxID=3915 RepID=A0AAQ3PC38_VIGMU
MTKSFGVVRWCAVGAMRVAAEVLIGSQTTFSDSFSPIADASEIQIQGGTTEALQSPQTNNKKAQSLILKRKSKRIMEHAATANHLFSPLPITIHTILIYIRINTILFSSRAHMSGKCR